MISSDTQSRAEIRKWDPTCLAGMAQSPVVRPLSEDAFVCNRLHFVSCHMIFIILDALPIFRALPTAVTTAMCLLVFHDVSFNTN